MDFLEIILLILVFGISAAAKRKQKDRKISSEGKPAPTPEKLQAQQRQKEAVETFLRQLTGEQLYPRRPPAAVKPSPPPPKPENMDKAYYDKFWAEEAQDEQAMEERSRIDAEKWQKEMEKDYAINDAPVPEETPMTATVLLEEEEGETLFQFSDARMGFIWHEVLEKPKALQKRSPYPHQGAR